MEPEALQSAQRQAPASRCSVRAKLVVPGWHDAPSRVEKEKPQQADADAPSRLDAKVRNGRQAGIRKHMTEWGMPARYTESPRAAMGCCCDTQNTPHDGERGETSRAGLFSCFDVGRRWPNQTFPRPTDAGVGE